MPEERTTRIGAEPRLGVKLGCWGVAEDARGFKDCSGWIAKEWGLGLVWCPPRFTGCESVKSDFVERFASY